MMWGMRSGGMWPIMGIGFGIVGLLWMLALMVIFLFFPIVFLVYFIKCIVKERRYNIRGNKNARNEEALSTLKKRYANGEITKEQYEEMKNTINNNE